MLDAGYKIICPERTNFKNYDLKHTELLDSPMSDDRGKNSITSELPKLSTKNGQKHFKIIYIPNSIQSKNIFFSSQHRFGTWIWERVFSMHKLLNNSITFSRLSMQNSNILPLNFKFSLVENSM
jgi:hypothetical protein